MAAPAASFLRRVWHLAAASLAVAVVSLSWVSVVSLVPQSSRPYVDGSCDDSLFTQVFSYNGFSRLSGNALDATGCNHASAYLATYTHYAARHGIGTFAYRGVVGPAAPRALRSRRCLVARARSRGVDLAPRAATSRGRVS